VKEGFETKIEGEFLKALLDLGSQFGFEPLGSRELELYCLKRIEEYRRSGASDFRKWAMPILAGDFRCAKDKPRWEQGMSWQVNEGKPMLFVGQIDLEDCSALSEAASFYIFFDPHTGVTKTVIQPA
jgi:hypothetical protein